MTLSYGAPRGYTGETAQALLHLKDQGEKRSVDDKAELRIRCFQDCTVLVCASSVKQARQILRREDGHPLCFLGALVVPLHKGTHHFQ